MKVVFYYGWSIFDILIRLSTRRPGQRYRDVPSHCAVMIQDRIYEYIAEPGWNCRCVDARDKDAHPVLLLDESAAVAFARSCRGRYDWDALACNLVGDRLPEGLELEDSRRDVYICSRFVCAVLAAGDLSVPVWKGPPSPNDVKEWVRSLQ